jgi:hypothetical protein
MPVLDANIKIARVFFDKNDDGCTNTPGYWKTHSIYGPAKYDDTWNGQEDTQFFNTGYTYYQIMHIPANEGAEYMLAKQLIAAKLNMDNGASIPITVSASLTIGENFFMGAPLTRDEILDIAELLDDYNNGLTGPGACVEEEKEEEVE